MEVRHGGVSWRCVTEVCHGGASRRCVMEVRHGGVSWRCVTEVCHGGASRRCVMEVRHGGTQCISMWGPVVLKPRLPMDLDAVGTTSCRSS